MGAKSSSNGIKSCRSTSAKVVQERVQKSSLNRRKLCRTGASHSRTDAKTSKIGHKVVQERVQLVQERAIVVANRAQLVWERAQVDPKWA